MRKGEQYIVTVKKQGNKEKCRHFLMDFKGLSDLLGLKEKAKLDVTYIKTKGLEFNNASGVLSRFGIETE